MGHRWRHGALVALVLALLVPAAPAHAAADITLTFTISSSSGADSRSVTVSGPGGATYFFDEGDGNSLVVTGQPGTYSVGVNESDDLGEYYFYGSTVPTNRTANATIPVTVPLHSLALDVQYDDGTPAPAAISLECYGAHPAGWASASSEVYRSVNGVTNVPVVNHAANDDPCDLGVDAANGSYSTGTVPGNAATFTYVIEKQITLTYNLSPMSGASRDVYVDGPGTHSYYFDEADGNSLSVVGPVGQYSLQINEDGGAQGNWSFSGSKAPATYTANATVPVNVPLHPLSLAVEDPDGSPVPATVSLDCYDAHPPGWTSATTYTANRAVNGTSTFLVANHAAGDDPCYLGIATPDGESYSDEVPGNAATFTYVVAQDPNAITLTFNVSSPSNATSRTVRVDGPTRSWYFDESDGNSLTVTGSQGDYSVYVAESGGPQGSSYFSGSTVPAAYTASASVPVAVPLHALALSVTYPGGAPAPASVSLDCDDAHPSGWQSVYSSATRNVSGVSTFFIPAHVAGDDPCDLAVTPETGPRGYATIPGSATTATYVVQPGAHVTGTLSDGLGHPAASASISASTSAAGQFSGSASTDASGHYDLLVATGNHTLTTSTVTSSELSYRLVTTPVAVTGNRALDLAPATDPLTVHLRSAGGTPVPSTVQLTCSGTPDGQSLIDSQYTSTTPRTGADFVLPATATSDGYCTLSVDPTVGVSRSLSVDVPNGGDAITVTVDPGITISGQVTVPGVPVFAGSSVRWSPDGHESATVDLAPDGSFTITGVAAGHGTLFVDVNDPEFGGVEFSREATLADGAVLTLAPHLDYLDLYLLNPTGNAGTGSASLTCNGSHAGDPNYFTSTFATRSGTGTIRLPGYAADAQTCQLKVTWSDNTVVNRTVTPDPAADTALTLLRNGVTLQGDPTASNDDDGVADATEAYAPNQGDGNSDGTPDYEQPDVASLPENGAVLGSGEAYVSVASPDGSALVAVTTSDVVDPAARAVVDGPPDGSELPQGLVDFTVAGAGTDPQVVLTVPTTAEMNGYTVRRDDGTWTEMPAADVAFTATTITLTLHDGGPLDRDPVAGRIRHPGGGTKFDVETPVVAGQAMAAPNARGWYGGNVTVRWTVTDNKDTIAAPANTVVTTEGDDVTASAAEVCDRRGNCKVGKLTGLKIDKTKPVVNLAGPANGATYVLGAVPSRQCTGTDPGGSGVPDGGACVVTVTGGAAVGTATVTARATDRAGNTATKTISYKLVYKAGGLVAPAAGSKLKVFKQGSTVVVRVKTLNAAGAAVTTAKAPTWLAPKAAGKAKGKPNQPVSSLKPDKGSVLVKRGAFWEYRWGTVKAKKGKSYVLTVRLDDGTTRTVTIGIG